MLQMIKRTSFCSLAFLLLTGGAFGGRSFAAPLFRQADNNQVKTDARRHRADTSRRRSGGNQERSKLGRRTIIFVGGKKGRHASSKRSNHGQTKKVNASLNPQPIPPGKQRQPE